MTNDDFAKFIKNEFNQILTIRDSAHKEYAHGETDNVFNNFQRLAKDLNMDQKKVLWVFFRKHLDGILAAINGNMNQREPIIGRIRDATLYLQLLGGMFAEEGTK